MKKYLKIILIVLIICPCLLLFSACSNGKSAYELAVENGFNGSVQEWLNSLKGTNGIDSTSETTYDIWQKAVEVGEFSGTYLDFIQNKLNNTCDDLSVAANKAMSSVVEIRTNTSSGGSGIIYSIDSDKNVYIITNYHVVYGASILTLNFANSSTTFNANIIGSSANYDLSILYVSNCTEIDSFNAKAATFDTSNVNIGSTCFAIGNSNLDGLSLTRGCISKENDNRSLTVAGLTTTHRLLCHDTYITKGNSGGGLFNNNGELIGVTNGGLKATSSSTNELINFAIPATIVKSVAENIIKNSSLSVCNFGLTFNSVNQRRVLNSQTELYETIEDIKISSIDEESPFKTHLQSGDQLVSIKITTANETIIKTVHRKFEYDDLILMLTSGDSIELTFKRSGIENNIVITKNHSDFSITTIQ